MAITWTDTPLIKKVKLPSGNEYWLADREGREKIEQLFETISGGVSFVIAWDGASTPVIANIPAGVQVIYNGTTYTGTMDADDAQPGAFYLVKSSTQTSEGSIDVYDEYVPVGTSGSKTWEKIGDTQVDLSDVVTDVTLNKSTTTVIGSSATLATTKLSATVSGGGVTVTPEEVTVVTGYASPSTDTFVKSVTAETNKNLVTTSITPVGSTEIDAVTSITDNTQKLAVTSIIPVGSTEVDAVTSITDNTQKLSTTSVTGVQASTTTASKATAATSQTTADGNGTSSNTNTDWLKGVSVSSEILTIGAATMDTQTTTQFTFADVTVPIKNTSATTVATGSLTTTGSGASVMTSTTPGTTKVATKGSSTTVATGALTTSGSGASVMTSTTPGTSKAATKGTAVTVATGATSTTGTGDAVVTGVTIGSSASAITALGTPSTEKVLGDGTTVTHTNPSVTIASGSTGDVTVGTGAWNSKDQKTVLDSSTSITVTKGDSLGGRLD